MRSLTPLVIGALLWAPAICLAQERTAGGSLQQEASWSALTNLIDQASASAKIANITANEALMIARKIELCGKAGLIYAPNTPDADAITGCKSVTTSSQLRWVSLGAFTDVKTALKHGCPKNTDVVVGRTCPSKMTCVVSSRSEQKGQGTNFNLVSCE